jgi:hypothetical protein
MPNHDERLEQRLRDWLEPDHATVRRIEVQAFADASRPSRSSVMSLVTIGVLLLVGAAGLVHYSLPAKRAEVAPDAVTPPSGRSSSGVPQPSSRPSGFSDGDVMVIRSLDGTTWAGSLVPSDTPPPVGTGIVVLEGGGR